MHVRRICSNTTCTNPVSQKFKQCLACRLSKAAHMRRERAKAKIQKEVKVAEHPRHRPWSEEKWVAFVRSGGLEGL